MERREIGVVSGDVEVLATDHPERRLGELAGDLGPVVGEREPLRLGEQRVSGKQRDCLAEGDVRARSSTALVVVVHRRQVVVDERERVHQLERGGRGEARPSTVPPAASAVARQITGRMRLPPPSSA